MGKRICLLTMWLLIGYVAICACSSDQEKRRVTSTATDTNTWQGPGGRNGGQGGPGGMADRGTGFYVSVPLTGTTDTALDPTTLTTTAVSFSGMSLKCDEATTSKQNILEITLSVTKPSNSETYKNVATVPLFCKSAVNISVSSLAPKDVAVLKVVVKDIDNRDKYKGTSDSYTSKTIDMSSMRPPTDTGTGTNTSTGTGTRTGPPPGMQEDKVTIKMEKA